MLPTYTDHPSDHPQSPLRPAPEARRAGYLAEAERYVARAATAQPRVEHVEDGKFITRPYVAGPVRFAAIVGEVSASPVGWRAALATAPA